MKRLHRLYHFERKKKENGKVNRKNTYYAILAISTQGKRRPNDLFSVGCFTHSTSTRCRGGSLSAHWALKWTSVDIQWTSQCFIVSRQVCHQLSDSGMVGLVDPVQKNWTSTMKSGASGSRRALRRHQVAQIFRGIRIRFGKISKNSQPTYFFVLYYLSCKSSKVENWLIRWIQAFSSSG